MKLTLEHSILAPIVADLAAVARGPSPAARAIRIVIHERTATFASSDGECWLEHKIECDAADATIAVDAPIFQSIIAGGFGPISLEAAHQLTIRYGAGKYRLPLIDPKDTVSRPAAKGDAFLISAEGLKAALGAALLGIGGKNDADRRIQGVHLFSKKNSLQFTGTDKNRMAIVSLPLPEGVPAALRKKGVLLPPGTCKAIIRQIEDGTVAVRVMESLIEFDYADVDSNVILTSKLIDEEFPIEIVDSLQKMATVKALEIPTADLLAAVNRVLPLADDSAMGGGRAMRLDIAGAALKLSVVSDAGAAVEEIAIDSDLAIGLGLNATSLKMALGSGTGSVRFDFTDDPESKPCRLTFSDRSDLTWILCAVRVNVPMLTREAA